MSKRQSRAAVLKGKFLNTLRNYADTPAVERDEGWGRRAVGFAQVRLRQAEELWNQAVAVLGAPEGVIQQTALGTEDRPIAPARTPMHTALRILTTADSHVGDALRTLAAVRAARRRTPLRLYVRCRRLSNRIHRKLDTLEPDLAWFNATTTADARRKSQQKNGNTKRKRNTKKKRK